MKKKIGIILGIILAAIAGAIALIYGIYTNIKGTSSITLIGGADGPTSVFLAGKVNSDFSMIVIIAGVIIVLAVLFLLFKRKK